MLPCLNCQQPVIDNGQFCHHCGAKTCLLAVIKLAHQEGIEGAAAVIRRRIAVEEAK